MSSISLTALPPVAGGVASIGPEAKALLAGAVLGLLLFIPAAMQDMPDYSEPPSRMMSDTPQPDAHDADRFVPVRQGY